MRSQFQRGQSYPSRVASTWSPSDHRIRDRRVGLFLRRAVGRRRARPAPAMLRPTTERWRSGPNTVGGTGSAATEGTGDGWTLSRDSSIPVRGIVSSSSGYHAGTRTTGRRLKGPSRGPPPGERSAASPGGVGRLLRSHFLSLSLFDVHSVGRPMLRRSAIPARTRVASTLKAPHCRSIVPAFSAPPPIS